MPVAEVILAQMSNVKFCTKLDARNVCFENASR